jgi:ATP-dependent helicase HrpA
VHAGHAITGHPALIDEGDAVGLRVLPSAAEARAAMWGGVRRLLLLRLGSPLRTLDRALPTRTKLALSASGRVSAAEVYRDCASAAVDELLIANGGPARDEAGFTERLAAVRAGFAPAAVRLAEQVADAVGHAATIDATLDTMLTAAHDDTVLDVRAHLDRLLHPGWIADAGHDQLPDVVRYVRALEHRVQKAKTDPGRDRQRIAAIQRLEREYRAVAARDSTGEVRTLLEELRVSTFAQPVGAKGGPSETKVRKALAGLS